ncbi:MAG: hypothetical protein GEU88_02840 [Solirubrobacterales bacterium]|nr:hypothetical protein [Solirubrobacterales bacterium]
MRLYLHIGRHKTGSTAIQHFFAANRAKLREQGLLYPQAGRPPKKGISYGHHLLARELTAPNQDSAGSWDDLVTEISNADEKAFLLSSENFDLLTEKEQFAALHSRLSDFDVKVIVYLRRQDEFLHAYYCTDVLHHGQRRGFHEYRKLPKIQADYLDFLSRWEATFGRQALIVRAYEESALVQGDVVPDICGQIAVDQSPGLIRPKRRRPLMASYPRNVINCVRSARAAGFTKDEVAEVRNLLLGVYRDRSSDADYLAPADRAALLGQFEESNEAVARRYLGRGDGVLFEDLDTGDDAAWHERYDGPRADLMISIRDGLSMFDTS